MEPEKAISFSCCTMADHQGQQHHVMVVTGHEEAARKGLRWIEQINPTRVDYQQGKPFPFSRYDIIRHDGSMANQLIEVVHPPDNRCGIIIMLTLGSDDHSRAFLEYESLERGQAAWRMLCQEWNNPTWMPFDVYQKIEQQPGFIRIVHYGLLTPWFLAQGDDTLFGDFALTKGLGDHPVFRLGSRWIVSEQTEYGKRGISARRQVVKTCMGCRAIERKQAQYPYTPYVTHYVYWHDGTHYLIDGGFGDPKPIPLGDDKRWVVETLDAVKTMLNGHTDKHEIMLASGETITISVKQTPTAAYRKLGKYYAEVELSNGELKKGTFEFTENLRTQYGNAHDLVQQKAERPQGVAVVAIKLQYRGDDQRKWAGVFFNPNF